MKERLRMLTWDDYGISKNRYMELKYFCMQYGEKKRVIRKKEKDGRIEKMAKDCMKIEKAAIETDKILAPYIIKSTTKNMSYEMLRKDRELNKIPVGKTEFYALRRLFYHKLDEEKKR